MYFNNLLSKLIYLTKRNSITNADIGSIINHSRQAISGRALRNSKFNVEEIKKIENYFNVNFSDVYISDNTLERIFNNQIRAEENNIGSKIIELKIRNNLSDIQMAGLLNITEQEFFDLVNNKIMLNISVLYNIKQNFNISVDWLLFG